MKKISQLKSQTLEWSKPRRFKRHYQLRAGTDEVAALNFEKALGSLALAETAQGSWSFKRAGFLRPRVTVRVPGADSELAVFEPSWTGSGTLQFTDGRAFGWAPTNFWRSHWAWTRSDGSSVAQMKAKFAGNRGLVEVDRSARSMPELTLLITLGWYLFVLMREDAASAAVVAG